MTYERIMLPTTGGESIPMDVYIPHVSKEIDPDVRRPSVVIFPGGGMVMCSEREGEPIALNFAQAGFNAFVVWYRVAPHRFPCPHQDAAAAIAYIRRHAEEFHCHPDRIAVVGFSAGGFLAGSMGVIWPRAELWSPLGLTPEDVRPNAMVLCYAALCADIKPPRNTFRNLLGTEDVEVHKTLSVERMVTADTPPAFLWHTWDDGGVPVENTLVMAMALRRCGVPAEVHVYPHGVHGLSLADETTANPANPALINPDCQDWPERARHFLYKVFESR